MKSSTWQRVLRRLYLLAVGSVALTVLVSVLVARSLPPPPSPGIVRSALLHLADVVDDADARATELRRLHDDAALDVAVYDEHGALVAANVNPPPPFAPPPPFDDGRGPPPHRRGGPPPGPPPFEHGPPPPPPGPPARPPFLDGNGPPGTSIVLTAPSGARFVAVVGAPGIREPAKLALLVVGVLLLLAIVSLPFANMLARPLAELARATDAFGGGDDDARADVGKSGAFAELARAFNGMAERITSSRKAERELLANVSHELRTPLARIRVALDLASEGDAAAARESLKDIEGDLGELERLVDDILTAARLDALGATPLRTTPTPLSSVVEEAARRFRTRHAQHVLVVDAATALPTMNVDPVLVRRAIDNFLDNAGKYSEPKSEVALRARVDGSAVVVVVEDHGVGIAKEDVERLFTPFFRAEKSRARSKGGVGLGLTLSKRIVEAHGGSVVVESEVGRGTKVIVRLPT